MREGDLTNSDGTSLLHEGAETLHELACSRRGTERLDGLDERREGHAGNLVASELGEELLLRGQVEVLVGDDGIL